MDVAMNITIGQNEEPSHDNSDQDYKISNSNDSCSDSIENLNRTEAESKQFVLITLVSQEPAIFNSKHEDYRNLTKKDKLWLTMSKQVGWSDCYCKNKWKAIRDQYCRELKRARTNCNAKIKWKYFKHLEFLRPYALSRNYRTKTKQTSDPKNDITNQEESSSNTQEEPINITFSINKEENSDIKPDHQWNICENADLLNDSSDITSQIIMQLSQQAENKFCTEGENQEEFFQEPQDDEDDDPIHTFLNIESYFEKELITLIQNTPVLYDISNPSYRNTKTKLMVWEEISRKLKRPVRQCRLKWKALRDQYIREHKRIKNMDNFTTLSRWKHYDAMSFLEPFIKERCEYNIVATMEDSKLDIPVHDFKLEDMTILSNKNENNGIYQYSILGDDHTSGMLTERLYSPTKMQCIPNDLKTDHLLIEEVTEVTEAQSSSNDVTTDEVGAFFKAVAIKIRNANMSAVAFTELQIDILKVITNALKE